MSELVTKLHNIYNELLSSAESLNTSNIKTPLDALEKSSVEAQKAWSHSWLGYQSRVYYRDLKAPPAGAHFSSEWGLESMFSMGTTGDWIEFPEDIVEGEIRRRAGNPDTSEAENTSETCRKLLDRRRDDILSILRATTSLRDDTFINKLIEEVEQIKALTTFDVVSSMKPSGQFMSRDMIALGQGFWTPPHIVIFAQVIGIRAPGLACELMAKSVRRAFSHLERSEKRMARTERIGTNVFIGHGRSKEWKDLKDFISERMRLPWDEFNRVPVAGIPNTVRLSTMLDAAAIALLVMTAEDEKADGTMQARMNVVHEAGLFQGRLGFSRGHLKKGKFMYAKRAGSRQQPFSIKRQA